MLEEQYILLLLSMLIMMDNIIVWLGVDREAILYFEFFLQMELSLRKLQLLQLLMMFNDPTNILVLGSYDSGISTNFYSGLMDDIRIWDDYRTDAEITDNTNTELSGTEANLVWYAPANTGSGTVLDDITSGNRDGTINGATWSTDTPF